MIKHCVGISFQDLGENFYGLPKTRLRKEAFCSIPGTFSVLVETDGDIMCMSPSGSFGMLLLIAIH